MSLSYTFTFTIQVYIILYNCVMLVFIIKLLNS